MNVRSWLCSDVAQLLNFMKYSSVVVTLFWIWDFKKWSWCESFCMVVPWSCLVQAWTAGTHWNSNSRNQNGAFGIALRGNTAPEGTAYPETSSYFSVPSIQSCLLMCGCIEVSFPWVKEGGEVGLEVQCVRSRDLEECCHAKSSVLLQTQGWNRSRNEPCKNETCVMVWEWFTWEVISIQRN